MAIARPSEPYPDQSWAGWGDPELVPALEPELLQLLKAGLGVDGAGAPAGQMSSIPLPEPRLDDDARAALAAVVGEEHVRSDPEARIRHTRGKSTPDLLRLRAGDAADAPDAVVLPASHEEVLALLRACSERRIAVVPFGGGTSVVGGLQADGRGFAGVVALDLRRLDALVSLDEESLIAAFEPGLRGPQAEALLGERGYTIGHFPQSFEYATVGGFAATRSSGQSSAGYGRFDDLVVGLRVATPAGELDLGRAPKSAAGPDLRQLVLGSEGAFGVVTGVRVRVTRAPAERAYEGWRLPSFAIGTATMRRLAQEGSLPTVLRLSDETETALNRDAGEPGGCLAIVGYEGTASAVESARAGASHVLRDGGGEPVPDAGEGWARERFRGPYLRDALLDAGALVETLETAAFWSALPELYSSVSAALRDSLGAQGTFPVVLCHISHVYATGASLYFTVACAQLPDAVAQWRAAKAAASDAILAAGGSITHHHGIGSDHIAWYAREIGPLGVAALRAVKATLDPEGIMNPGVLLEPSSWVEK